MELCVRIAETASGPDDPSVGTSLTVLGLALQALGDRERARECLLRALAILEDAYGPTHPEVGIALSNAGSILMEVGDCAAAPRLLRALPRHWPSGLRPG